MDSEPFVEILLATYQGCEWLDVQLATIFAQTHKNWRLLVRDDGSTDGTKEIIVSWRDRFPEKIEFLDEGTPKNLGLTGNFSALMAASTSEYVMFADQDDVWYSDKITKAVTAIISLKNQHNDDLPLLIHTDARMVNANLCEIHPSALRYRGFMSTRKRRIGNLCLENSVQGCTIIANRALIRRSIPIPEAGLHVDWWLALVATAFGFIEIFPEISMDWRRHGANTSELSSITETFRNAVNPLKLRKNFYQKLKTNRSIIQSFLERFGDQLTTKNLATLQMFLNLQNLGFWARRCAILQHRVWFSSWIRTIGLLVLA